MGSAPSLLSMVSVTSARPRGGREVVPAKTTSSILPPRRDLAPCSPMTQHRASTMLDLPEPFGPTTQVMPVSRRREVAEAKDLKPRRVRLFRYTGPALPPARPPMAVQHRSRWTERAGWAPRGDLTPYHRQVWLLRAAMVGLPHKHGRRGVGGRDTFPRRE